MLDIDKESWGGTLGCSSGNNGDGEAENKVFSFDFLPYSCIWLPTKGEKIQAVARGSLLLNLTTIPLAVTHGPGNS